MVFTPAVDDTMLPPASVVTITGILYIVTSSILFLMNGVLFVTMFKNSEYHTATYRIIRCICLACMAQLFVFFVGGIMTLSDSLFDETLNKVFGGLLQSSWFLYVGLSLSLAFDRLLCFVVISPKKCSTISVLVLTAAWAVAIGYLAVFLVPGFGFGYCCNHQYIYWFYMNETGAEVLKKVEIALDFSILSVVLVFYCVVFSFLMKLRNNKSKSSATAQSFKMELRILLIAIVSFVYEATFLLWFFWGEHFLPDSYARHIITTMLWISECGVFAVSTIIINSSVRRRVNSMLTTVKTISVTKTTTVTKF
ncbi:hypothetical protein QR680_018021 [Steinernema hermaphroditum]|uniref:7TM GPCR serpentine receptor class x (Srx) domain-containing protein n=1 Tax=Steinernema hermaphroditum TaxID=289476 RepID=A0AA39HIV4_9BILA|nr:hypothetical protein QR680_018021 [Steinernema hermaphroditum]